MNADLIVLIVWIAGAVIGFYPLQHSLARLLSTYGKPDGDDHALAALLAAVACFVWPVVLGAAAAWFLSRAITRWATGLGRDADRERVSQ